MSELRLLFDKSADGDFAVRIVPPSGNASEPVPFKPFLDDDDFEDLRWYLEDFMDLPDGGSLVRAHRVEEKLRHWGRSFYDALFKDGDNRELLNQMQADDSPRLLTLATRDVDILRLPWELMADSRGPLVRQEITIRRQLETARRPIEFQTTLPLRILYVVSRPGDLGFIDPRLSSRSMLDALAPLGDDLHIDFCRPPTLPRLEEMLSQARRDKTPYHLIHFDGHGTFLPKIELGALCFEKPDGAAVLSASKTDYVHADRLGEILSVHNIPLVILEACRTGAIGKLAVFRAIAPRLIEAGVGSVISMSHAVHVEAARILLERFYRELVTGCTVGQSLEQGRAALIANPHRWIEYGPGGRTVELKDWYLPHLYQRSQDLKLVPPRRSMAAEEGETAHAKKFDLFLSHQHADSARVERIALDLKSRHGLRVWLDKWECGAGPLHDQCVQGVAQSRFTLLAVSQASLNSKWVAAEQNWARADDPQGWNVIPLLLEDVTLPPDLKALLWQDFRDPANDSDNTAKLADLIPPAASTDRQDVRRFRLASRGNEDIGAFPPAPIYRFQGRAHELYELEWQLRSHRAVLLYAMGGMGKTALAGEAAQWWTRSGLFPDGACFLSFEQPASAERITQVLGTYLDGNEFNALPENEQSRRARELFRDKSVLMVWDNFESVLPAFQSGTGVALYSDEDRNEILALFRDWTGVPDARGRLLITCRPEETGLLGARKHELSGLARPDSLWLLVRVLETAGVDLDDPRLGRDKLNLLLDTLADHPLSIELVGPHLKNLTPEEIIADFGRLLAQFKRGEGAERNESLLASLEFSKRRLSEAAQDALPWLGLFTGGVFEQLLLDVSGLDPQEWETVRGELEATALIRVEHEMEVNKRPYLRFHPTLAYANGPSEGPSGEARKRFIGVYLAFMKMVNQALGGSHSRGGLNLLSHEEANCRTAVRWVVDDGRYAVASELGETFSRYLQMSGRLHERDAWVMWLAAEVRKGGFSVASAANEIDEAWTLFNQGQAKEAIQKLLSLLERLSMTTEFDTAFQLASTQLMLGRVLYNSGVTERAVSVLEEAVARWEVLVTEAGERSPTSERVNLSIALGDLANALRYAGRLDEALEAAERGLNINRDLGNDPDVAFSLSRCAQILMVQGRFAEADARYDEAIAAARTFGVRDLEVVCLENQGSLADDLGQFERAANLYKRAIKQCQEMNDDRAVMQIYNSLGVVEQKQGHVAEARSWYDRSLEIARRLSDTVGQASAAQNIGIVCQVEGDAARQEGRESEARQRFEEAGAFIAESLQLARERGNEPSAASSLGQLAQIHLFLGELDEAERFAHEAREIFERLGLMTVHMVYNDLGRIARARGDAVQSADWDRKRDTVLEELEHRAQGPGDVPHPFLQAIQALSIACATAGFAQGQPAQLDPDVESTLAQIEQLPPPLSDIAPFLRRLAAGEIPSLPTALPTELQQLFAQLIDTIRESRGQS
jgi:tetratricopeptide (TPR) repeat protein